MAYFSSFPLINYKFGNEETTNIFPDISAYVEIIDQIKDNINYYSFYNVIDGERPDTLSFKLYGTTSYYWTFILLNDNIKEKGWPLTNQQLTAKAQKDFPNTVITTTASIFDTFLPGQTVVGSTSGEVGTILRRRLDFGQLIIEGSKNFLAGEVLTSVVGITTQSLNVVSSVEQYNSIHHYEDEDGRWVDVNPFGPAPLLYTPITNFDRYVRSNDNNKIIKIIKPAAINTVNRIFKEALAS